MLSRAPKRREKATWDESVRFVRRKTQNPYCQLVIWWLVGRSFCVWYYKGGWDFKVGRCPCRG